MKDGVTLDCQKIQAEWWEQLQNAILNIGHTDRVDHDAESKEGRKKYLTGKRCLRVSVLLEKKPHTHIKKKQPKNLCVYIEFYIYTHTYNFGTVTYKAERFMCR